MYCFVMFYVVKYKASNLSWKVITAGLTLPLVASCLWNQIVFYNTYFVTGEIGFCFVLRHSPLLLTKLISLFLEGFILIGLSFSFIVALGKYVQHSTITNDNAIKQGILKTAIALAIISTLSFITSTLPVLMSRIQTEPTVTYSSEVWRRFLPQTILFSVGSWPVLATPICLLLTLKSIRQTFLDVLICCKFFEETEKHKNRRSSSKTALTKYFQKA